MDVCDQNDPMFVTHVKQKLPLTQDILSVIEARGAGRVVRN